MVMTFPWSGAWFVLCGMEGVAMTPGNGVGKRHAQPDALKSTNAHIIVNVSCDLKGIDAGAGSQHRPSALAQGRLSGRH
jgi:hypothetical protein